MRQQELEKENALLKAQLGGKVNGFQNWIETFYEVVDHLTNTADHSGTMSNVTREQGGRTAQYVLAEQLTDEFEARHKGEEWIDLDWWDTIESFLKEKETEHFKSLH